MKNGKFELFAITAPGLEAVCARELTALALADVRPVAGGVDFTGELRDIYRANLCLRTAARIVVRFGSFRCRDFPELYRQALRLPWGRFVRPGTRVKLRVSSRRSRLQHTGRIAETVGEALERALGHPIATADGPEQLVLVRFEDDVCLLSVDSSGELLHRRGYREETAHAPMRETLAAGLLLLLEWDSSTPLLDPLCGSGTLPIEAALMADKRAPGSHRAFAFMDWPRYRPGLWQALLLEASRSEQAGCTKIHGADRDAAALAAARRNAERAGVEGRIDFNLRELACTPAAADGGLLVCNPPYGQRLGRDEDLRPLFQTIGEVSRHSLPRWRVAILSPADYLAKATGLPLHPLAALNNGGIPVTLWATT